MSFVVKCSTHSTLYFSPHPTQSQGYTLNLKFKLHVFGPTFIGNLKM